MLKLEKKKANEEGLNANEIVEVVEELCKRAVIVYEESGEIINAEYSVTFKNGLIIVSHCRGARCLDITLFDRVRDELDSTQFHEYLVGKEYEKLNGNFAEIDLKASLYAAARRIGKGVR